MQEQRGLFYAARPRRAAHFAAHFAPRAANGASGASVVNARDVAPAAAVGAEAGGPDSSDASAATAPPATSAAATSEVADATATTDAATAVETNAALTDVTAAAAARAVAAATAAAATAAGADAPPGTGRRRRPRRRAAAPPRRGVARARRRALGEEGPTAADGEPGACEIAIDGTCTRYPKISNRGWFADAALGGPAGLMSDAACAARAASWAGDCGDFAAVQHRVAPATALLPALAAWTRQMCLNEIVYRLEHNQVAVRAERADAGIDAVLVVTGARVGVQNAQQVINLDLCRLRVL